MHLFKKHRSLWNNILKLALVLLLIALVFILRESQKTVPAAISKGSRLLENIESSEGGVDQAKARELVLADESVQSLLSGKDFGFLGANPLTSMESRHWSNGGCTDSGADGACARVSFYNYSEGGTINAVVNLVPPGQEPVHRFCLEPWLLPRPIRAWPRCWGMCARLSP
jgi:hypothetical protein